MLTYVSDVSKLSVELTDEDLHWIEARVADGHGSSVESYIVELLQQDRDEETELNLLKEAIDKGRASGVSTRNLQQIYDDFVMRRNAA